MAITRRQFVSRLGALAAAAGMSQLEISKIAEAFATNSSGAFGPSDAKPKVVWVHGAECTGCSTSLLGILENPNGNIFGTEGLLHPAAISTLEAAGAAGITPTAPGAGGQVADGPFTLWNGMTNHIEGAPLMNIADVVIDVIDLQYHETIMGMGGDLAAQWLNDFADYVPVPNGTAPGDYPFVLVVEGALQDRLKGGAWNDVSDTTVPWCSIGHADAELGFEIDMSETVVKLAKKSTCAAIIPIGQCASYGGYPGAKPKISATTAKKGLGGFDPALSQTGAKGVYDYLRTYDPMDTDAITAAEKVINVPGCPTNPWWFVLTVVMIMADLVSSTGLVLPAVVGGTLDYGRRAKKAYPIPVHSAYCPRYKYYTRGVFAAKPGQTGCLQKLGCKGLSTNSLCGVHGWNNQQPQNGAYGLDTIDANRGGHCTQAGHPCMGCTEKGYPDSFVPFVKL